MKGGIEHRRIQNCAVCKNIFFWAPGPGLCPYCDLSDRARQAKPYAEAEPCPADCCPPKAATA